MKYRSLEVSNVEEEGDALGIGRGRRQTIRLVNERVEVRVGLHEIWRHRQRIVEVGERRSRMRRPRVKNGLRSVLDFFFDRINRIFRIRGLALRSGVSREGGPHEVVVDDVL